MSAEGNHYNAHNTVAISQYYQNYPGIIAKKAITNMQTLARYLFGTLMTEHYVDYRWTMLAEEKTL